MPDQFLAIDVGNVDSAYVEFDVGGPYNAGFMPTDFNKYSNEYIRQMMIEGVFGEPTDRRLLVEMPKPRGMPTAATEMETMFQVGRFVERWHMLGGRWSFIFRDDVKLELCGRRSKVTDANVRQAVIDLFGGEETAIGGKKCPACKGSGLGAYSTVICETCTGAKTVPGKKPGTTKKCKDCNGKGVRKGDREDCSVCGGSSWEYEPGPVYGAAADVWQALALAAFWVRKPVVVQRLAMNQSKCPPPV